MFEEAIRAGIYSALSSSDAVMNLIKQIYDHVPQPDDPGGGAEFPYISIGDNTFNQWDTDTEIGAEVTVTIHTWSRYKGRKEVSEIHDAIYSALHRRDEVNITGFRLIGCDFEHAEIFVDADGETRHGVQRYRMIVDSI